ncbi:MAG: hypothetical protein JWL62_2804 [Hyphomicrobiales bacterium]|nr:hypothetical protein [Hyphomicrobiales bacterium]
MSFVPVLLQFVVGLFFGLGLIVAGMSNPAKVQNFLDFAAIGTGGWDASLAFVMAGAVAVTAAGYRLVLRRTKPLFAAGFLLPRASAIDARLMVGAALFGICWGLVGFCPGPALTALGTGSASAMLFVAAMFAGMLAARWLADRMTRAPA